MKQLIEDIAKALVDIPEEVSVSEVAGEPGQRSPNPTTFAV